MNSYLDLTPTKKSSYVINGPGFFIVKNIKELDGPFYITRVGNFKVKNKSFVNKNGMVLCGKKYISGAEINISKNEKLQNIEKCELTKNFYYQIYSNNTCSVFTESEKDKILKIESISLDDLEPVKIPKTSLKIQTRNVKFHFALDPSTKNHFNEFYKIEEKYGEFSLFKAKYAPDFGQFFSVIDSKGGENNLVILFYKYENNIWYVEINSSMEQRSKFGLDDEKNYYLARGYIDFNQDGSLKEVDENLKNIKITLKNDANLDFNIFYGTQYHIKNRPELNFQINNLSDYNIPEDIQNVKIVDENHNNKFDGIFQLKTVSNYFLNKENINIKKNDVNIVQIDGIKLELSNKIRSLKLNPKGEIFGKLKKTYEKLFDIPIVSVNNLNEVTKPFKDNIFKIINNKKEFNISTLNSNDRRVLIGFKENLKDFDYSSKIVKNHEEDFVEFELIETKASNHSIILRNSEYFLRILCEDGVYFSKAFEFVDDKKFTDKYGCHLYGDEYDKLEEKIQAKGVVIDPPSFINRAFPISKIYFGDYGFKKNVTILSNYDASLDSKNMISGSRDFEKKVLFNVYDSLGQNHWFEFFINRLYEGENTWAIEICEESNEMKLKLRPNGKTAYFQNEKHTRYLSSGTIIFHEKGAVKFIDKSLEEFEVFFLNGAQNKLVSVDYGDYGDENRKYSTNLGFKGIRTVDGEDSARVKRGFQNSNPVSQLSEIEVSSEGDIIGTYGVQKAKLYKIGIYSIENYDEMVKDIIYPYFKLTEDTGIYYEDLEEGEIEIGKTYEFVYE